MVYQDMGNHNFAIKDFEKAIELDPVYQIAFFLKATSKIKSNLVHEAIKDFLEAGRLEDDIPGIYDGLGQCYHNLKNYDEALENYNLAITKAPTNVEFLKNRAQCHFDLQQFDHSSKDLNTAIDQNPHDP
jgi:tetratricopeptide (TPR) repeat protein